MIPGIRARTAATALRASIIQKTISLASPSRKLKDINNEDVPLWRHILIIFCIYLFILEEEIAVIGDVGLLVKLLHEAAGSLTLTDETPVETYPLIVYEITCDRHG